MNISPSIQLYSFRFKTQWCSWFGLAATEIWKHHNALSFICYVTQ